MFNGFRSRFIFLWLCIGLFVAAMVFRHEFIVSRNTSEKNALALCGRLQKEVEYANTQINKVGAVLNQDRTPVFGDFFEKQRNPLFIFLNKRIFYWSDNAIALKYRDILGDFSISSIETPRGSFVCRKEVLTKHDLVYEVIVLIPLVEEFAVANKYLQHTVNRRLFTDVNINVTLSALDPEYQPINMIDKTVFWVKFGSTYANASKTSILVLVSLFLLSGVCLVRFIVRQVHELAVHNSVWSGLVFLLSILVAIRSLMLLTGFPLDQVYSGLFDPRHYASSFFNPSLGDLILNVVCLLAIGVYVFRYFLQRQFVKSLLAQSSAVKMSVATGSVFCTFFWLAVHHQTMRTLNFDSQWSMDLGHSLTIDYLKLMSYAVFLMSGAVYILLSHVCFRLIGKMLPHRKRDYIIALAMGLALFLSIGLLFRFDLIVVGLINSAFLAVVSFFRLHRSLSRVQYLTFIYLFSFGLPVAAVGIYANYQFRQSKTELNMSRLADQLLEERDFFTGLQLSDIAGQIREDIFIQQRISSPYASKSIIEKKIRSEYLNKLDKFDISVYVFNSRGEPFDQFNIKDNYHDFKGKISAFATETEGLYFINQALGQATARYLVFIDVEDRGDAIGYILLDLRQKRLVPNSVFPLLTNVSANKQQEEGMEEYSYGVFVNNQLQYNSGDFNYRNNMGLLRGYAPLLFEDGVQLEGFIHKAFRGEGNRFVIVSARESTWGQRFANFSFLFLIYIFTILIILIVLSIYQRMLHITLNYSTRIQLYLNFAFFTPLIIVSLSTVSIIVQTFKTSMEDQYLELADNLSNRISGPLNEYRKQSIEKEDLSDEVSRMAEVSDLDITVFNTNGRLITSSLNQVYQNNILSGYIQPRAYQGIMEDLASAFILEEKVGALEFKSAYVAIRSYESGKIIGILGLPFFASENELEKNIIDVMSNIINIFTVLFIVFLVISFFVSRGLTFPLRLITQKIKRTTLSSFNEPLGWNSDDEIGLMVSEYNRMLVKLEDSKRALAKSEKESAWREMARQVAHEIKNPLTPMKLSLQHMKRTLDNKSNDSDRKHQQINSLLEQIETLNDIATSFSDFARMPNPAIEEVELRALLLEIIELYDKSDQGTITAHLETGEFMVEGDRKWLGRAFSNLIINAFQAVGNPEKAQIEVVLRAVSSNLVGIEFRDNGSGIPEHIREKVFSPNFSTKYTGSGLGLAITKKGIEHASGTIWFESEEHIGTTFFIEIPRI